MKIIGTLVDKSGVLAGLKMEGLQKEFGIMGTSKMVANISLGDLVKAGFKNSQIKFTGNSYEELNGFQLRYLPMEMMTSEGIVHVDNSIELTARIKVDGETAGFEVKICSGSRKLRTADVISISNWYNTKNYTVRHADGKAFLAGRNGLKLEDLPVIDLGASKTKNKGKGNNTSTPVQKVKPITLSKGNVGLVNLFEIADYLEGKIIKFKEDEYKAASKPAAKTSSDFTAMKIGEIASPKPKYSDHKLNITAGFMCPGTVFVTSGSSKIPVYTYVHKSKNICRNGENTLKYIGISVDSSKAEELKAAINGILSYEEITDKEAVKMISALSNGVGTAYIIKIDVSNIPLIALSEAQANILSNEDVFMLTEGIEDYVLRRKILKKFAEALKEPATNAGWKTSKSVLKSYEESYAPALLQEMAKMGIDIYTGAYTVTEAVDNVTASAEKDEEDSNVQSSDLECKYSIKGMSASAVKADKMEALFNGVMGGLPNFNEKEIINIIKGIKSYGSDITGMYDKALKEIEEADRIINHCRKKIWYHNISMLELGNGKMFTHNSSDWTPKNTRKAGAVAYDCKSIDGFYVTLMGLTI